MPSRYTKIQFGYARWTSRLWISDWRSSCYAIDENGVISPGGVGYDINCGVRLIRTNLTLKDVMPKIKDLVNLIYENVPSGLGSTGKLKLTNNELNDVLNYGAKWAVEKGYGWEKDIDFIEERGAWKLQMQQK